MRSTEEAALSLWILSHSLAASTPPSPPAPSMTMFPIAPPPIAASASVIAPQAAINPQVQVEAPAQSKLALTARLKGTKAPMQNGAVAVEEMARLMRVYGPIKSVRVRNSGPNKAAKVLSVKRKVYVYSLCCCSLSMLTC